MECTSKQLSITIERDVDAHFPHSILRKDKVVATHLINQLDIADGLKELLTSKRITLKSLQSTSASDLAKILGTDEYVAKIVHDAATRSTKTSTTGFAEENGKNIVTIQ